MLKYRAWNFGVQAMRSNLANIERDKKKNICKCHFSNRDVNFPLIINNCKISIDPLWVLWIRFMKMFLVEYACPHRSSVLSPDKCFILLEPAGSWGWDGEINDGKMKIRRIDWGSKTQEMIQCWKILGLEAGVGRELDVLHCVEFQMSYFRVSAIFKL